MTSTNTAELTEEQEKFLSSLEEEFKDRFTENDEEFKAVLNERLPIPPIVENWEDFRNRDERHDNYRPRYSHYHDHDGDYERHRARDWNREHERDRHRNSRCYHSYYREDGGGYSQSSRPVHGRHEWNYYSDSYRS